MTGLSCAPSSSLQKYCQICGSLSPFRGETFSTVDHIITELHSEEKKKALRRI